MKTQKISLLKRIGIGAVAGLATIVGAADNSLGQTAGAGKGEQVQTPSCSVRTRAENTHSEDAKGNESNLFKSTLGLTNCSSKDSEANGEFFRMYDNQAKQGDKNTHWTSAGFLAPYTIEGLKSITALYGAAGDKQGIGVESKHSIKDLSVVLNAEKSTFPSDATRIGIGADYKINSWLSLGGGFDQIETKKGTTRNFLANSELRLSDKDVLELAYRLSDTDGSQTNSVVAGYGHFGKDEKVGTRTHAKFDWNQDTQYSCASFQSIIAQNPTFGAGSYPWLRGRANGDMFDSSVVDQSVTYAEAVNLMDRTKGGLVGQVIGSYANSAGIHSSSIRGDAGYVFSKVDLGGVSLKPGVVLFDCYNTRDGQDSVNKAGVSGLLDISPKSLEKYGVKFRLEATGSKSSDGASDVYTGVSAVFRW